MMKLVQKSSKYLKKTPLYYFPVIDFKLPDLGEKIKEA